MSNAFDDVRLAVSEATDVNRACDANTNDMARLIVGRLRFVHRNTLRQFKHELQKFDMRTGEWKK